MKGTQLIPICLISVMVGQLLPRWLHSPARLTLGCVAYLALLYVADLWLSPRREPE